MPDKVNIRHLKHTGPLGLAYRTNMYNISLNNNIIPHTWKLANIIPIPKPNKDMNIGTSYRPISLLSVIAITLEKTLLPYITNNIPHISTQHGFKSNHSTSTALHNINNTIATGMNQNKPPKQTTRKHTHSSTRHEQGIRHSQHTHTHTQTTPNKHPTHHYQIHHKLHQRTQSMHYIQKQNINTTPILKWWDTKRRS